METAAFFLGGGGLARSTIGERLVFFLIVLLVFTAILIWKKPHTPRYLRNLLETAK